MACSITGLKTHWVVDFADQPSMNFNSVRTLTRYLRERCNCEISQSNFYDIVNNGVLDPNSRRAQRFKDAGITRILYTKGAPRVVFEE